MIIQYNTITTTIRQAIGARARAVNYQWITRKEISATYTVYLESGKPIYLEFYLITIILPVYDKLILKSEKLNLKINLITGSGRECTPNSKHRIKHHCSIHR